MSIGAIEPQFYAALRQVVGLDGDEWAAQFDARQWPALKAALADHFRTRSRDEWCAAFHGHEVCFAPVLDFDEAVADPHNIARSAFVTAGGITQPAPAPRYSASQTVPPAMADGHDAAAILADCGFSTEEIAALV